MGIKLAPGSRPAVPVSPMGKASWLGLRFWERSSQLPEWQPLSVEASMPSRNIVIVGGGFAGTAAIRRLERHLPAGWRTVLINEETFMTFTPLLPEVVSGSLFPSHSVSPLRGIVDKAEFVQGCVTRIDPERREVIYRDHDERRIEYAHLVLACGTLANLDIIPGMTEHGLALKTLGDALHLRNRIIDALEEACQETDPDRRRWLLRFLVVGGGNSGVEVAGAIYDFLRAACKHYAGVEEQDFDIRILEHGPRLVEEFPKSLGDFAEHTLTQRGIGVHCDTGVSRVTANGAEDQDGNRIDAANVVCTVGTQAYPLIEQLPFEKLKGRLCTEEDMSVKDAEGIWAIGDCAAVPNHHNGELSPPTAQFAERQGQQLADNIVRCIRGEGSRGFSYRPRGELATIGHHKAVAQVFGMRFSGRFAWLLWRAFYLFKLPTLLRKVQVYFEWNISMLFPQDVTQFQFERSGHRLERERRRAGQREVGQE
ncbi:MAG: NAD(P)/FAD-dependent oxidoreductase [Guyparkeria sp.]|uniref:NAD(P)/FAD-dependent oxidoreductase n=1 Tax=Guyparkeria sp. TaxID=2035736 RepID=UPI0039791C20